MKTRLLNRTLAIVLSVFLLLPCLTVCGLAATLEGYQDHPAADAIDRWVQAGIISGSGSNQLNPDGALTRGQGAALFAKLLDLKETADLSAWTDLAADGWYRDYIAKSAAAGILEGVSDTEMAPNAVMSSGDFYAAAARALHLTAPWQSGTDAADETTAAVRALAAAGAASADAADAEEPITYATAATLLDELVGTYVTAAGSAETKASGITLVTAADAALTGSARAVLVTADNAKLDLAGLTGGRAIVTVAGDNVAVSSAPAGTSFQRIGDNLTVNGTAVADAAYTVPGLQAVLPETDRNENLLAEEVEGGSILHTWTWSFDTIREKIPEIAAAGFSAIQTSPISGSRAEGTALQSWASLYTPNSLEIGNSLLGTLDEFKAMVETAHSYGIKVIVDAVINHNSGDFSNQDWGDPGPFGDPEHPWAHAQTFDWYEGSLSWAEQNRLTGTLGYQVTRDLNTQNQAVQDAMLAYLQKCVEAGADGFRFDAMRSVELPGDPALADYPDVDFSSDYLPTILQNGASFQYGESLQGNPPSYDDAATGYDDSANSNLAGYQALTFTGPDGETHHLNTTLSFYGQRLREAVSTGNLDAAYIADMLVSAGADADLTVTWVESHDNYVNDKSYDMLNEQQVNLAWVILSAREKGTPLYYSRPDNATAAAIFGNNDTHQMGSPAFQDPQVVAVNFFRSAMAGLPEVLSNPIGSNKVLMIERGNAGAVIVNLLDTDLVLTGAPVCSLADGTYTDQVYGSTFTVQNGKISGTVKAGRAAVIYNPASETSLATGSYVTIAPSSGSFYTSEALGQTLTVYPGLIGVDHATYSIDGGEEQPLTAGASIEVGEDAAGGATITVKITGYDADGKVLDTAEATYTKVAFTGSTVRLSNTYAMNKGWDAPNAYFWGAAGEAVGGWPGMALTLGEDGFWYGAISEEASLNSWNVIFNQDGQLGDKTLSPNSSMVLDKDGNWVPYVTGMTDPSASLTATAEPGSSSFSEDTITVTLHLLKGESATYTLSSAAPVAFTDGQQITIGEGLARGDTVSLVLTAYDAAGAVLGTQEYAYTRSALQGTTTIYVDPAIKDNWEEVAVYIWGDASNGTWPGQLLTEKNAEGFYVYHLPESLQGLETLHVIFNNNGAGEQIEFFANGTDTILIKPDAQMIIRPSTEAAEGWVWEPYEPKTIIYTADAFRAAQVQWDSVFNYLYTGDGTNNAGWPGICGTLQTEGDWAGYWMYEVPETLRDKGVIHAILDNGNGGGTNQVERDEMTLEWGDIKVMTADGRWVDAAQLTSASVAMEPAGGTEFYTDTLQLLLRSPNCVSATVQVGDADPVAYEDMGTIDIGKDLKDGESVTVKLVGVNAAGAEVTAEGTFTKHFNAGVESKKVLFIGNSYTYYNEIWSVFQKIAYSAGLNVDVDSVYEGSHYLYMFSEEGDLLAAQLKEKLAANDYDIVFLQEQSIEPITNYERFEASAKALKEQLLADNPNCQVILYQTWGRKAGSSNLTSNGRGWTNPTMAHDLEQAYEQAGKALELPVSPAGTAFLDVYTNHADTIELYNEDLQHPSGLGTYLAALVHAQTALGVDPDTVSWAPEGTSADTAAILKAAAKAAPTNVAGSWVGITPCAEGSTVFTTDTLTVTLHALHAEDATYTVDGGAAKAYAHGDTIVIGEGVDYGKTITVSVSAAGAETVSVTFTKQSNQHYLVVGWNNNNDNNGFAEDTIANFKAALLDYLKSQGATQAQLDDVVIQEFPGNVATMGAAVLEAGNVDIMIGVGKNFSEPTTEGGATAGVPAKELVGGIQIGSKSGRYAARLTDSETAQLVLNWIVETYPDQG